MTNFNFISADSCKNCFSSIPTSFKVQKKKYSIASSINEWEDLPFLFFEYSPYVVEAGESVPDGKFNADYREMDFITFIEKQIKTKTL